MRGAEIGFSALEWAVISLARRDRPSSLDRPGPIASAVAALFGTGHRSHLADPRLEALRRMAVHARHAGRGLTFAEIRRFLTVGFRSSQLRILVASVSAERGDRPDHP